MVLNSLKMNEKHTNPNSKLAAKLYQLQGNVIKLSTSTAKNNPGRIISSALHYTGKKNDFSPTVWKRHQSVFPGLSCLPIAVYLSLQDTL